MKATLVPAPADGAAVPSLANQDTVDLGPVDESTTRATPPSSAPPSSSTAAGPLTGPPATATVVHRGGHAAAPAKPFSRVLEN